MWDFIKNCFYILFFFNQLLKTKKEPDSSDSFLIISWTSFNGISVSGSPPKYNWINKSATKIGLLNMDLFIISLYYEYSSYVKGGIVSAALLSWIRRRLHAPYFFIHLQYGFNLILIIFFHTIFISDIWRENHEAFISYSLYYNIILLLF